MTVDRAMVCIEHGGAEAIRRVELGVALLQVEKESLRLLKNRLKEKY